MVVRSSEGPLGFISFAVGAIVMRGIGDFFPWFLGGSAFSVAGFGGTFSWFGEPDLSEAGEAERLLQFLSQSSGVMRLEVDEAFTR